MKMIGAEKSTAMTRSFDSRGGSWGGGRTGVNDCCPSRASPTPLPHVLQSEDC